jgi:hypothetical protein
MSYTASYSAKVNNPLPSPASQLETGSMQSVPHKLESQCDDTEIISEAEVAADVYSEEIEIDLDSETDYSDFFNSSITSSLLEHTFENGRRYHMFREGRYAFPNDETELDRQDVKHHLMTRLCKKLHFVPLDNPQQILDLGTGTGIWARESKLHSFQTSWYEANVIGMAFSGNVIPPSLCNRSRSESGPT